MSFYIDPIIGFRSWKMSLDDVALVGRVIPEPWTFERPTEAQCFESYFKIEGRKVGRPHTVPNEECTCGLHAWTTQALLEDQFISSERVVMGAVVAWGKITLHEKGWRAQNARPICLAKRESGQDAWHDCYDDLLDKIAENYGIPTIDREDLTSYASTFGQVVDFQGE